MAKSKSGRVEIIAPVSPFTRERLAATATPMILKEARELVDSPQLIKRVRDGNELSCAFVLYDRVLHCSVAGRKYSLQELCTCKADYFCTHAAALVLTYIEKPDSFLDLEGYLDQLQDRPHHELVEMLRQLVGRYPASSLEALGLPGFQPSDVMDGLDTDLAEEEFFADNPDQSRLDPLTNHLGDGGYDGPSLDDLDEDPDDGSELN